LILTVSAAVVLGFVAGLLTFRKAQQWCPVCGVTLTCSVPHNSEQAPVEVGR
jgi:hypothetical protein